MHSDHYRLLLQAVGGDRFLICSDGLTGELPDEVILPLLTVGSPQQAAESLVAAANDAGGRGDLTAVVVDIVGDARSADETPTLIDHRRSGAAAPSGPAAGPPRPAPPAGAGRSRCCKAATAAMADSPQAGRDPRRMSACWAWGWSTPTSTASAGATASQRRDCSP